MFDTKLLDLAISHKKLFNEIKKELGQAFNDDNDDSDNDNDKSIKRILTVVARTIHQISKSIHQRVMKRSR